MFWQREVCENVYFYHWHVLVYLLLTMECINSIQSRIDEMILVTNGI